MLLSSIWYANVRNSFWICGGKTICSYLPNTLWDFVTGSMKRWGWNCSAMKPWAMPEGFALHIYKEIWCEIISGYLEHMRYIFWNRLNFKHSIPLFSSADLFILYQEFKKEPPFTLKIIVDLSLYDPVRDQRMKCLGCIWVEGRRLENKTFRKERNNLCKGSWKDTKGSFNFTLLLKYSWILCSRHEQINAYWLQDQGNRILSV